MGRPSSSNEASLRSRYRKVSLLKECFLEKYVLSKFWNFVLIHSGHQYSMFYIIIILGCLSLMLLYAVFKISGCPRTTKKVAEQPFKKTKKTTSFLGGSGSLGNAESITEWFKNVYFFISKEV